VEYLHGVQIVHRDLKPANILIFQDMTAKVGDFGMARDFSRNARMAVGREICTLWYRAPELLMGAHSYTAKIDEWAVGCLALEMLCGQNAMPGRVEQVQYICIYIFLYVCMYVCKYIYMYMCMYIY
jgi:serine/threonine protein kinase